MKHDPYKVYNAPDPRVEARRRMQEMPVPIYSLVDQPELRKSSFFNVNKGTLNGDMTAMTVELFYTVDNDDSHHPIIEISDFPSDPAPIEETPAWLYDLQAMRQSSVLWSAVHTKWAKSPTDTNAEVKRVLLEHAKNVAMNTGNESDQLKLPVIEDLTSGKVSVAGQQQDGIWLADNSLFIGCAFSPAPDTYVSAVVRRSLVPETFKMAFH